MNSRHRAREVALQILYRYDVASQSQGIEPPSGGALARDLIQHFDHFGTPQELREFAANLVSGTLQEQKSLDQYLERHAANWRISRMAYVDRSILRMAVYEMLHFPEISSSIVIDEAVELAKQFGTSETPGFVNGVLDAVKEAIKSSRA